MESPGKGGAVRLWSLRYLEDDDWLSSGDRPVPHAFTFKHDHPVLTGALDRAETRILTCDAGGQAHLWAAKDGRRRQSFRHGKSARGAAFHPDDVLQGFEPALHLLGRGRFGVDPHQGLGPADAE